MYSPCTPEGYDGWEGDNRGGGGGFMVKNCEKWLTFLCNFLPFFIIFTMNTPSPVTIASELLHLKNHHKTVHLKHVQK